MAIALALAIGLTAGVLLGRGTVDDDAAAAVVAAGPSTEPAQANTPQPGPTPTPSVPPAATGLLPALPAADEELAPPGGITIPRLGIEQSLIELGVTPDRKLEVPTNGTDIGWWRGGPVPGEAGGAVIAAHVNWNGGQPAVFSDLSTLEVADEVLITREDGSVATYQVTGIEIYPKAEFPNELIYRLDGDPQLTLITCGGDFVGSHYVDNIVVFADLVGDTRLDATA